MRDRSAIANFPNTLVTFVGADHSADHAGRRDARVRSTRPLPAAPGMGARRSAAVSDSNRDNAHYEISTVRRAFRVPKTEPQLVV